MIDDGFELVNLSHQAGVGLKLLIGLRGKRGGNGDERKTTESVFIVHLSG